jgi:magnesium-transporting ATPase (P-type)
VTVICSDKTGTLTCNQMTVVTVILPEQTLTVSGVGYAPKGDFFKQGERLDVALAHDLESLLMCATLCNDAVVQQNEEGAWGLTGDPTEGALQTLAAKAGIDKLNLHQHYPRLDCIPFESEHQYMATLHQSQTDEVLVLLKGAPETVLAHCQRDLSGPLDRECWEARMTEAAKRGERVLALARRILPKNSTTLSMAAMDDNFELLGMVGMLDPPRAEAMAAVAECQVAGLRVAMITGDHAITASAIAKQIGLNASAILSGEQIQMKTVDVISRASPQHKLRLVKALQSLGELVAMTGDGVNDAPAIKVADIGVAMGNKGTAAAREAADLVLTDDNFATISNAVREGRVVLDNIKKSMLFILPTDVAEAGVILLAILGGLSLPITASQILWINTVTAVTFSLAIAFERPERGVMKRPPRLPTEPLITKLFAARIIVVSALLMAFTFTAFEWELSRGHSLAMSRTTAVNMLIMCQMAYLFNVKYFTHSSMRISAFIENRVTSVVCGVMIVLQALFTYSPWMQSVFSTQPIDVASWLFILAFAILMFLVIELEKAVLRAYQVQVI